MSITHLIAWAGETLRNGDTSVNRLRLTMPRLPNQPTPAEAQIVDQNNTPWVTRAELDEAFISQGPAIIVRQANEFESQFLSDGEPRPFTVDLAVMAAVLDSDSAAGQREIMDLLRCAHRALVKAFQATAGAEPVIDYFGIEIRPGDAGTTWLPPPGKGNILLGGFVISFRIHDPWALGF